MSGAAKIPALVVGTGFGCRIHVPALRAAGFDVAGLVGTDFDRTQRRAAANNVPQAFVDLDLALTRTGAKVISIATPPHTHGSLSLLAISRGCHVLCEKPFARDVIEARMMSCECPASWCRASGRPRISLAARARHPGACGRYRLDWKAPLCNICHVSLPRGEPRRQDATLVV